jgi:hypothetical protein
MADITFVKFNQNRYVEYLIIIIYLSFFPQRGAGS